MFVEWMRWFRFLSALVDGRWRRREITGPCGRRPGVQVFVQGLTTWVRGPSERLKAPTASHLKLLSKYESLYINYKVECTPRSPKRNCSSPEYKGKHTTNLFPGGEGKCFEGASVKPGEFSPERFRGEYDAHRALDKAVGDDVLRQGKLLPVSRETSTLACPELLSQRERFLSRNKHVSGLQHAGFFLQWIRLRVR